MSKSKPRHIPFLIVVLANFFSFCFANTDSIEINVEGGAGRVSGSMAILSFGDERWMVDCGAFYPEIGSTAEERQQKADEKTADISAELLDVNAILLTHAHLDHIGRLPLLVRSGYSRPVYATEATIELSKTMLQMQIRYETSRIRDWAWSRRDMRKKGYIKAHWNDKCQWLGRIHPSNKSELTGVLPELESYLSPGPFLSWQVYVFGLGLSCVIIAVTTWLRDKRSNLEVATAVDRLIAGGVMPKAAWRCIALAVITLLIAVADRYARRDIDVSPCKVCAEKELIPVMNLMREIKLNSKIHLSDVTSVKAINAGHIPGSCSLLFELKKEGRETRKVLFSGDLGSPHSTIIEGPQVAESCDIVIVECTYGCKSTEKDPQHELRSFREDVSDVIQDGGVAWIPAFALDRSQKVLHQIRIAQKSNLIDDDVPIFMPSPTADSVSQIYSEGRLKGWFRPSWESDITNLFPPGLQKEWIDIENDELPKPAILITTSGMMERAFSESLLGKLLPNAEVSVFLVGYQDPFSPGGKLIKMTSGNKTNNQSFDFNKDKQDIAVNATVKRYSGFSSHAKADDIDLWLGNQNREFANLILVHGPQAELVDRDTCLQKEGWRHVYIATEGVPISFIYDE